MANEEPFAEVSLKLVVHHRMNADSRMPSSVCTSPVSVSASGILRSGITTQNALGGRIVQMFSLLMHCHYQVEITRLKSQFSGLNMDKPQDKPSRPLP